MQNFRQYSVWKDPYMQSRVGSRPSMLCIILAICHPPSLHHRDVLVGRASEVCGSAPLLPWLAYHCCPAQINGTFIQWSIEGLVGDTYLPDHQGAMIIWLDHYVLGDDVGLGALLVVERIALAVRIKVLPRVPRPLYSVFCMLHG